VYFGRKKRYGGKMMPLCEILPDWDAVIAHRWGVQEGAGKCRSLAASRTDTILAVKKHQHNIT
jgi:hypothetical protein